MTKRKISQLLICFLLAVFLMTGFSSHVQAASYTKVNWLTFANNLDAYLWAWRAPTGTCERSPHKGSCLSGDKVVKIMNQLTDPNGDGDFSDMYFKIPDPNARINYLKSTKNQSYVMRTQVLNFEKSKSLPIWIYVPDIDSDQIHAFTDSFFGASEVAHGQVQQGDSLIRTLAFYDTGLTINNVKVLTLRNRNELTPNNLYKIYQTARMHPYIGNCKLLTGGKSCDNSAPWQANEIAELNKSNDIQNTVITSLFAEITPTKAQNIQKNLKSNSAGKGNGGIAILKGSKPSGSILKIGSNQVALTPEAVMLMFQFSSTSSMAVRYKAAVQNIGDGMSMLYKSHQSRDPELLNELIDEIPRVYVTSEEYLRIFCDDLQSSPINTAACADLSTYNIYYGDNWLDSSINENNPAGTVIHEFFHYIRVIKKNAGSFNDLAGMYDEAFTDWMTWKTLHRNGQLYTNSAGYYTRVYFTDIKKRLQQKNGWTEDKANEYLENAFFQKSYSDLNTMVKKDNFYQTLNTLFGINQDINEKYNQITDPATTKSLLAQYVANKHEIENFILN